MTKKHDDVDLALRLWHNVGRPGPPPTKPVSAEDLYGFMPIRQPERVVGSWAVDADARRMLLLGHHAREMEDKWNAFTENGTVHLIRSWTSFEVFRFSITYDGDGPDDGAILHDLERETDPDIFDGTAREAVESLRMCLWALFAVRVI